MDRKELTQIYYNEMLDKFLPKVMTAFEQNKIESVTTSNEVKKFENKANLENMLITYTVTPTIIEFYVTDRLTHYTKSIIIPIDYPIEKIKKVSLVDKYTGTNNEVKRLIEYYSEDRGL